VSKAFDSCDYNILLKKMGSTGLDENGIKLMESYSQNRAQLVVVNRKEGGCFVINIGVPQGSELGPTLDLHFHTKLFCLKFADHSSFEGAGKNKDALKLIMNMKMAQISRFIIHSEDKLIKILLDDVDLDYKKKL
jgi:hypothetical protein